MNNKTAFGTVVALCDNCRRLIYERDTIYYARYAQGELCLCDQCVTVRQPEENLEEEHEGQNL